MELVRPYRVGCPHLMGGQWVGVALTCPQDCPLEIVTWFPVIVDGWLLELVARRETHGVSSEQLRALLSNFLDTMRWMFGLTHTPVCVALHNFHIEAPFHTPLDCALTQLASPGSWIQFEATMLCWPMVPVFYHFQRT